MSGDGGPAFPTPEFYDERQIGMLPGATLRDYFAAKAMHALMVGEASYYDRNIESRDMRAKEAYDIADAMLRARES